MKTLQIIVPCYNEAECVELFYQRVEQTFAKTEIDWSILYVDDGSRDGTLKKIRKLADEKGDTRVKYISFSRNFGKEAAIYAGLENARGDYIALMDADLQHPPEMLPEMIAVLEQGADCCGARRVSRAGEPKLRSAFSRMFYAVINHVTDMHLVQGGSDFRVMRDAMVKAIVSMPERERFTKGMLSWVGFDTQWIEYENVERAAGKTKWSFWGLVRYGVNGFFSFAVAPLRIVIWLGFLIDAVSAVCAVIFFFQALYSPGPRTGYGTLVLLVTFFGGATIFLLGVIGEYLARIYAEIKHRPIYISRETNLWTN